jgi:hypothetical protein
MAQPGWLGTLHSLWHSNSFYLFSSKSIDHHKKLDENISEYLKVEHLSIYFKFKTAGMGYLPDLMTL